jgi:hypothetical protein
MKSQSIAYLLDGTEHVYWILDLEDEVHAIWVIWTSGFQECKGNFFFQSQAERARSMGFIRAVKEALLGWGLAMGKCDLARSPSMLFNSLN